MSAAPVLWENLPENFTKSNALLVYKTKPGVNGRIEKIPYDLRTARPGNDPKLGATLDEVKAALSNGGGYAGPGFYVESDRDGILVIDIDNCVDTATGDVAPYATEIVREINSYTELSPSGTGLHIWLRGKKPGTACRKGIEIYSTKRFLTLTGYHVPETPKEIREVDITSVYNRMLHGDFVEPEKNSAPTSVESPVDSSAKPNEMKHGGKQITSKLQLLLTGKIVSSKPFVIEDEFNNSVEYPSQSECDEALCVLLAFKHKGDIIAIDKEFRESPLYRPKFDRPDYRDKTIKNAVAFYKKTEENSAAQVAQVLDDDNEVIDPVTKLPDFPQFTGTLADLSNAMSPDIPYAFKFTAALTHMGLIRSGLDTLEMEPHIQPRFYSVLISEPGRGKTAAINEVSKIFKAISNQYRVYSSIDSGPALCDAFVQLQREGAMRAVGADNSNETAMQKILLSPDEIKGLFEKAKITMGSRNSMLDELLKLFEGNTTGNRVRGAKINIHIETAHLAVLGGATETGYSGMFTATGAASDGLQSRIIPVGIEDCKMPGVQRPPNAEALCNVVQRLALQVKAPGTRFKVNADALDMYLAWWDKKEQTNHETRIDGLVKRLLTILCRSNDVETIDIGLMQQAIAFGDFVIASRQKYSPLDASTWCQMEENLIVECFKKHGGEMSASKCKRSVHPERRPGGLGPYLQAWKNEIAAGTLRESGKTAGKAKIYRLFL